MKKLFLIVWVMTIGMLSYAQSYELVWEDNFDGTSLNPAIWNVEQEIGIWNTGSNQELQHYKSDNVTVGDDGDGNNCLILTAKKENYNGYPFTSGRINSKGKFAFKYGKIEARIKLPDLENGLWPAFWLLGSNNFVWPQSGEIDIMEAGHAEGITNSEQNTTFGGALHWEHADSYAAYGTTSISPSNLNGGYHTFTMEWSATNISMYLDGNASPYFSMNVDGEDAEEFRDYGMYIIFNLAVGGMFPGIYDQSGVTAPMPAQMFVDYVKVYQKSGEGGIEDSTPVLGDLGVYVDGKSYEDALSIGYDGIVSSSGTTENNSETAHEGSEVLSYNITNGQDFDISILSLVKKDISAITSTGSLDVYFKTNLLSDFKVGMGDALGVESWVTISSASSYNIQRDGNWSRVAIPFSAFAGLDFTQIDDVFMVEGTPSSDGYLSIDKVILSNTTANFELFGIYTDNPAIGQRFIIDDISGHIYIWNNTMLDIEDAPSYDGTEVLAFSSPGTNTWFGFGLTSDAGLDLSQFATGYLKFALRTSDTNDFWVGVAGANNSEVKIQFSNGSDPYEFVRDGHWHRVTIPVADLVSQGLDLSSCGNVFMLGGEPYISDILIDDIYFSASIEDAENTNLNVNRNDALVGSTDHIITADYFGIYSENTNITKHFNIDNETGHIYTWANTLTALEGGITYDGSEHLNFSSNGAGWYGFGIFADVPLDLTHYSSGYLSLSLKTSSSEEFWLGISGAAGSEGKITINNSSPYNFARDSEWHRVIIPVSELVSKGLNLEACGNIFMLGGSEISDIAIDDVILTVDVNQPVNPNAGNSTFIDFAKKEDVKLFPVPVKDVLYIIAESEMSSFELYNQAGTLIQQATNINTTSYNIGVSNLSNGIYLLKMTTVSGSVILKKVIKK